LGELLAVAVDKEHWETDRDRPPAGHVGDQSVPEESIGEWFKKRQQPKQFEVRTKWGKVSAHRPKAALRKEAVTGARWVGAH